MRSGEPFSYKESLKLIFTRCSVSGRNISPVWEVMFKKGVLMEKVFLKIIDKVSEEKGRGPVTGLVVGGGLLLGGLVYFIVDNVFNYDGKTEVDLKNGKITTTSLSAVQSAG